MVIINEENEVIAKTYQNNDNIVNTIIKCLEELSKQINIHDLNVLGVGCTGSGREFTKVVVGADTIKTEILAHLTATQHYVKGY